MFWQVIWVIVQIIVATVFAVGTLIMLLEAEFQNVIAGQPTHQAEWVVEYYGYLRTSYAARWLRYRLLNNKQSDIFNKIKSWNIMWQNAISPKV